MFIVPARLGFNAGLCSKTFRKQSAYDTGTWKAVLYGRLFKEGTIQEGVKSLPDSISILALRFNQPQVFANPCSALIKNYNELFAADCFIW